MSDTPDTDSTFDIIPDRLAMAPPKNPPQQQPKPAPRVVRKPAPAAAPAAPDEFEALFEGLIAKRINEGNTVVLDTIEFMQKYIEQMDPSAKNPPAGIKGAEIQQKFFKSLRKLIETASADDFKKAWNVVLAFFRRYKKGALGEQYVNRFAEFWPAKDEHLTAYQRIVNLALVSADPEQRAGIAKRVNLLKTMEIGFTEAGRANITTFYVN